MLLSQQAHLIRLTGQRAVVRVSGNWLAMVQSRRALLEQAVAKVLGNPHEVVLEAAASPAGPASAGPVRISAPAPNPPPVAPPPLAPETGAPEPAPPPAPAAPEAAAPRSEPPAEGGLEREARRLADFFAGEVVPDEEERNSAGGRPVV
jgi:DNA polymerase-3 subunit gamma/tau